MAPNLYLATSGGLAIAEGSGGDWRVVGRALEGDHATSVIAREGVILIGTRRGVFRSDDGGRTWDDASAGLAHRHVRWLAYHPDRSDLEFAGTEPATIFVSHDGARSWRQCEEVAALRDRLGWFLPYSPAAGCVRSFTLQGNRGYAAVEVGGLLRSDDGGETWALAVGSDGIRAAAGRWPAASTPTCTRSSATHRRRIWCTVRPAAASTARATAGRPGSAATTATAAPCGSTRPIPIASSSARPTASIAMGASRSRAMAAPAGRWPPTVWVCPGRATWSSASPRLATSSWRPSRAGSCSPLPSRRSSGAASCPTSPASARPRRWPADIREVEQNRPNVERFLQINTRGYGDLDWKCRSTITLALYLDCDRHDRWWLLWHIVRDCIRQLFFQEPQAWVEVGCSCG